MGKDQSPRAAKRSRPSPNINSGNPNPIPSPMHHQGPPGPGGAGGPPHSQGATMPNGIPQQRPGSVQMGVGGPMSMAHQPTPMAMQPTGPQGNLQPNTMVPQAGNTNAVMMVTPQMGGNVSLIMSIVRSDWMTELSCFNSSTTVTLRRRTKVPIQARVHRATKAPIRARVRLLIIRQGL